MKLLANLLPLAALLGLAAAAAAGVPLERRGLGLARIRPETTDNPMSTPASLHERSTQTCDQWGSIATGNYVIYNDLWGQDTATSGSQCVTVSGLTNGIVSWQAAWTWAGGSSNVKAYANAALDFTAARLADISSLRAVWAWSYTGASLVANVAFDAFLRSSCSSSTDQYEVMIWLAALNGAGPISSTGSAIATVTLAGHTYSLYYGLNGSMQVYSFVATSQVAAFDADVMDFFDYLVANQGVASSACLTTFEAGTEPFTGSGAVLKSNYYAVLA